MPNENMQEGVDASAAGPPLIERARIIMQDFVDKCDRGEARSVRTYADCRQWLAAWAGAALADSALDAVELESRDDCRAALLAHFSLAQELEATPDV